MHPDPLDRTLDELEGKAWGPPPYPSHLVRTCHELRRKPLRDFTVEDLRIMIGQQIGLPHLMPLALAALEEDPLAEGDYYPGDLLSSVVGAGDWLARSPAIEARAVAIARRALADPRLRLPQVRKQVEAFVGGR